MKPKTTILMVLAIGCGLAAAFMTNKLIADRGKGGEDVEKVMVLVAKKKIPALTYIKKAEDFFEPQEKNKNDVPKSVLNDLADKDLKDGFRVSGTITEGNFLTRDNVISKDLLGLPGKVPNGMRAFAIRADAAKLGGGFVLPDHKVDVVWTDRSNNGAGTLTILQDILVLAVDTTSGRNAESAQTILGQTVTLAVKPEEAQKLALASQSGELTLSLRSPGDTTKIQLAGAKQSDLARLYSDPGEEKPEIGETTTTGPGTTPVPPIPSVPATTPIQETKPAPVVVEETPAKPLKTHTLTIVDGNGVAHKHVYVWNEDKNDWSGPAGGVTRTELERKSEEKK